MVQVLNRESNQLIDVPVQEAQAGLVDGRFAVESDKTFNLHGPMGEFQGVQGDSLIKAISKGWRLETPEEEHKRFLDENYSGVGSALAAGALGVARGATFNLSDMVTGKTGEYLREANPIASGVGEVGGAVGAALLSGGTSAAGRAAAYTPAALAARAGDDVARAIVKRYAKDGVMRNMATKGAAYAAAGGIEGGLWGAGDVASRVVLKDPNLTAEAAIADIGLTAMLGAAGGGLIGSSAPPVSAGFGKLKGLAGRKFGTKQAAYEHALKGAGVTPTALKRLSTEEKERLGQFIIDSGASSAGELAEHTSAHMKGLIQNLNRVAEEATGTVKLADLLDDSLKYARKHGSETTVKATKKEFALFAARLMDDTKPENLARVLFGADDAAKLNKKQLVEMAEFKTALDDGIPVHEFFKGKKGDARLLRLVRDSDIEVSAKDLLKRKRELDTPRYSDETGLRLKTPVQQQAIITSARDRLGSLLGDEWVGMNREYGTLAKMFSEHNGKMHGFLGSAAAREQIPNTLLDIRSSEATQAMGILGLGIYGWGPGAAAASVGAALGARAVSKAAKKHGHFIAADFIANKGVRWMAESTSKVATKVDDAAKAFVKSKPLKASKRVSLMQTPIIAGAEAVKGSYSKSVTSFLQRAIELDKVATDPTLLMDVVYAKMDEAQDLAPEHAMAIASKASDAVGYVRSKLPPRTITTDALGRTKFNPPSDMDISKWERYLTASFAPATIIEDFANGKLTPEAAETARELYPLLHQELAERVYDAIHSGEIEPSWEQLKALSIWTGTPMHECMHPEFIAVMQTPNQPQSGQGPEGMRLTGLKDLDLSGGRKTHAQQIEES